MKRGLYQLLPLLTLLDGGCYAALGGRVQVPLSDTSIGTTGGPEVDIGLLADFGDAQIFASSRVGGLIIGDLGGKERSRELVGGVAGFMLEQKPSRGSRIPGLDWRVAFSYASLLPENSDLEKSGTLVSLMIGPNFKTGSPNERNPLKRFRGGYAPGITISRLSLSEETTWSIGFSFKLMLWMDKNWGDE